MAAVVIQKAFSAGEWAPELNARVDLAKYHSAAALLRNFFVDYRGGASTRPGTKYILQAYRPAKKVRLIPFQASFTVNYVLEFGDFYIRFYVNGGPVLEAATTISGATQANPGVITDNAHGYNSGDWIFISGVGGMTQLNGNYYSVQVINANSYSLTDLFGNVINTTTFGAFTSNGSAQRVYTLTSPFAAGDLALVKFTQSVNSMILCHPSYPPQVLTLTSAANWSITAINFGPTIASPTGAAAVTTLAAGSVNYAYAVTAVDVNGQESGISSVATLSSKQDLRTTAGTNTISWSAVAGAISYNIYKTQVSYAGAVPNGQQFGFIGNSTGLSFVDSNIAPDFSQCPPIVQNPFAGASVVALTLTGSDNYATVPAVTVAAPGSGVQATAYASLGVSAFIATTIVVSEAGVASPVGQSITFPNGVAGLITAATPIGVGHSWNVTGLSVINGGSITGAGNAAPSPLTPTGVSGGYSYVSGTASVTWSLGPSVGALVLIQGGFGYTSNPAVTFSAGAATATATIGTISGGGGGSTGFVGGNPSVPGFFDERLVLAATPGALQTFYMSQPGAPYNFSISDPIEPNDAITGSIVSGKLNAIKSMLSAPTGLIMFTSQQAWLVNGGSSGASVTPIDVTATGHAYNGASDVPPLQINFDYLYVQSKGSKVRDLTYNFYTAIYTGTDVSVLSSHLFFGYQIQEWAWAEEPFGIVWCVRNDGTLLALTFMKEQEVVGWAHSDTNGLFQSVASITEAAEPAPGSSVVATVDAVYLVVQRVVNGQTLQYIERMADRFPQDGYKACWAVDAGLQYSGAPATVFTGLQHLTGMTVVGLADGVPFTTVVSATGSITLGTPATLVTVGLKFTPQLQTLAIDVGDPTIQTKLKNIPFSSLRVRSTLGLSIGKNFTTLVPMKDLVVGAVNSTTTGLPAAQQVVTDLWTGDARTFLDSAFTTYGQYCVEQDQPFYATVLGTIPALAIDK
jgi:Ubiquitin-activating enzyme E1 FCCH domain